MGRHHCSDKNDRQAGAKVISITLARTKRSILVAGVLTQPLADENAHARKEAIDRATRLLSFAYQLPAREIRRLLRSRFLT